MNVVIIVIVPIIGKTIELVAPMSAPPLATTSASSPPEESPKPALSAVTVLCPCDFEARYTVKNFAPNDAKIRTMAGIMKRGICVISMRAPIETKNKAANISLIGVARTLVTECTFDSAINTQQRKLQSQRIRQSHTQ